MYKVIYQLKIQTHKIYRNRFSNWKIYYYKINYNKKIKKIKSIKNLKLKSKFNMFNTWKVNYLIN